VAKQIINQYLKGNVMDKQFTVIAVRWFDRTYGNTYHSVRCIRHSDGQVLSSGHALVYGYGDGYQQTAIKLMAAACWLPDGEL
jgi:hypothetical protein